jgi:hypothetical protein
LGRERRRVCRAVRLEYEYFGAGPKCDSTDRTFDQEVDAMAILLSLGVAYRL